MHGCKYLEWERERKVYAGEMGEGSERWVRRWEGKMGEEWSQIWDPGFGRTLFGPLVKSRRFLVRWVLTAPRRVNRVSRPEPKLSRA
jgi:hypothetical protein